MTPASHKFFSGHKKNSRRGFTIFFIFMFVLVTISAVLFNHSFELETVAGTQKKLLNEDGYIRPAIDPRVNDLLIEALENK